MIFQVGPGNTIPSLDPHMDRCCDKTELISEFFFSYFSHEVIFDGGQIASREGFKCVETRKGFCLIDSNLELFKNTS